MGQAGSVFVDFLVHDPKKILENLLHKHFVLIRTFVTNNPLENNSQR